MTTVKKFVAYGPLPKTDKETYGHEMYCDDLAEGCWSMTTYGWGEPNAWISNWDGSFTCLRSVVDDMEFRGLGEDDDYCGPLGDDVIETTEAAGTCWQEEISEDEYDRLIALEEAKNAPAKAAYEKAVEQSRTTRYVVYAPLLFPAFLAKLERLEDGETWVERGESGDVKPWPQVKVPKGFEWGAGTIYLKEEGDLSSTWMTPCPTHEGCERVKCLTETEYDNLLGRCSEADLYRLFI